MFYLSLFFEGEASSSVLSHYFNITSSTTSASTASASLIPASSGLSAGAKAGIAIGVAGAMLLGVLASWLILGRRAKTNNVQTNYYEPAKVDYRLQQHRQEVNAEPTVRPQEINAEQVARYELPPVGRPQH